MSGLTVSSGENLSINDLLGYMGNGCVVARGGHLGNQYLSNLLLHTLGIPGCLFDRNLLLKDVNYHPSCIIQNRMRIPIAVGEDVLVPFAKLDASSKDVTGFVNGGKNPGQVHFDSLTRLFGEKLICSESGMVNRDQALLEKLVDVLSVAYPEFFLRHADCDGKTRLVKFLSGPAGKAVINFNETSGAKIRGEETPNFQEGIIPKIEATLVISAILGALSSGTDKVFELSGPDMVNYCFNRGFRRDVIGMYERARREFPSLPVILEFVVVPSFYFRFGSLESERREMDALWERLKIFSACNKEKRQKLKSFSGENLTALEENAKREKVSFRFNQELDRLAGEIFTAEDIVRRMEFSTHDFSKLPVLNEAFFSQYDLLKSGEKLYVPEEVRSLSMKEVAEHFRILGIAKRRFY